MNGQKDYNQIETAVEVGDRSFSFYNYFVTSSGSAGTSNLLIPVALPSVISS